MISHKHKFIFVHIPKCAGTTVELVLHKYASPVEGCSWAVRTKNIRNKEMFNLIRNHNDYFKFTFSRNPYSRMVSLYYFLKYHNKFDFQKFVKLVGQFLDTNPEKVYRKIPDNSTFLKSKKMWKVASYDFIDEVHYPLGYLGNGNKGYHLLPQYYFVSNGIDFIGKIENLQEDFNIICDKIGIPRQKLQHKNKSKHKHYTEYYDDETRQIVAEKYAKDIEYFGYEFGE